MKWNPEMMAAIAELDGLAQRWEQTRVWHNPPFLDGTIHITTKDLRAIWIMVRALQKFQKDEDE